MTKFLFPSVEFPVACDRPGEASGSMYYGYIHVSADILMVQSKNRMGKYKLNVCYC